MPILIIFLILIELAPFCLGLNVIGSQKIRCLNFTATVEIAIFERKKS